MLVLVVLAIAVALAAIDVWLVRRNPEVTRRPLPPIGPMTPTFH